MVAAALAVGLLLTTTAAADTSNPAVAHMTLVVDGQTVPLTTKADTVAEALRAAGYAIGQHDVVAPHPATPVGDGSVIAIQRGRQVAVTVDGHTKTLWTTATTLDQALAELGLDERGYLVADRNRRIPTDGLAVTGQRLRTVTLTDGANAKGSLRTPAVTVADLLAAESITLGDQDSVSPAAMTPVSEGLAVTVTRKRVTQRRYTAVIPEPPAQTVEEPNVGKGNTAVTQQGRPGSKLVTEETVVLNGVSTTTVLAEVISKPAQPTITSVGTKETGLRESWSRDWDQMAYCESTNRWDVNTGNGTYGGLQFMTETWLAYGGGDFAPRADLATKEQQIIVAERLYAKEGLRPWHCARLLGWGWDK